MGLTLSPDQGRDPGNLFLGGGGFWPGGRGKVGWPVFMYDNDVHMGVSVNGGTPKMDGF